MGGFGQAITQGIGRLGNEYGESREYLREQKQNEAANRLKMLQASLGIMELQRRLKQAQQPDFRGTFQDERGNVHAIVIDPQTGLPKDQLLYSSKEKYPDFRTPQEALGYALRTGDTDLLKRTLDTIRQSQRQPTTPAATEEYEDWVDAYKKSHGGRAPSDSLIMLWHRAPHLAPGAMPEVPDKYLRSLAEKWNKEGVKPPAKYQAQVEEYMSEHNLQVKTKLSASEEKLQLITNQMQPKVSQLKKLIEDNKLQGANSVWDALKQRGKFMEYQAHIRPDKVHADLIKAAAALQVMGAGPWQTLGRGKYMYETIVQHLPDPKDTPTLLYDKAQFLQGIIDEARESLPHTEDQLNELDDLFDQKKLVPKGTE